MGLVLFGWLTAQSLFRDETDVDVRKQMLAEANMLINEELTPVGVFDDGREPESEIDSDGERWMNTDAIKNYPTSTF
jgi:hypothetical protein